MSIPSHGDTGYIVECDLKYPSELHDLHSDYPMAPEHLTVSPDMLSDFCTIRYDTRCYFNVRSKAYISQLNLPHGTDN